MKPGLKLLNLNLNDGVKSLLKKVSYRQNALLKEKWLAASISLPLFL